MSEPVHISEILPEVMQDIHKRTERRELKKRCFANRLTRFRNKKFVSGFDRINEPLKGRCFGMAEQFCWPVFRTLSKVQDQNEL